MLNYSEPAVGLLLYSINIILGVTGWFNVWLIPYTIVIQFITDSIGIDIDPFSTANGNRVLLMDGIEEYSK